MRRHRGGRWQWGAGRMVVTARLVIAAVLGGLLGGMTLIASADPIRPPASLPIARSGYGAAFGPNGHLYVAGGMGPQPPYNCTTLPMFCHAPDYPIFDRLDEYDPATRTWTPKAPMPGGRANFGFAAQNGKLYAIGGINRFNPEFGPPNAVATTFEYDPDGDTWTTRADMPNERKDLGAVAAADGKIYVFGGSRQYPGSAPSDEVYDPVANSWTTKGHSTTVWPFGLAYTGGKVFVIGSPTQIYDVASDTWSTGAGLPSSRRFPGATHSADGAIFVFGGLSSDLSTTLTTVERYDPSSNSWSARASMPTPGSGPAVTGPDGTIYALGHGAGGIETYFAASDTWSLEGTPPTVDSFGFLDVRYSGPWPGPIRYYEGWITSSRDITLTATASDIGSGVAEISFSNDGTTWGPWRDVAPRMAWTLPDGDGMKTVYARVRDAVGNLSPSASATILLDTVAPSISRFTLSDGALATTSSDVYFQLSATDGALPLDSYSVSLDGGPFGGWKPYSGGGTLSLGGPEGPRTVAIRVRDAAGNVSQPASATIKLDTQVGTSFGVSINNAAVWTSSVNVTLSLPALPGTAKMMISNDGGFAGAQWEPYDSRKPWTLNSFAGDAVTMTVYARFGDANGNELANSRSSDTIILDSQAPTGSVAIQGGASGVQAQGVTRTLSLTASDTQSGAAMQMRLSNRADFSGANWQPFRSTATWDFGTGGTVYAQFRDGAGNLSPAYSQSLPNAPPPGTSPGPVVCSPRPPISVSVQKVNGSLVATLAASGENNALRAVRFEGFSGAVVDVGDQANQAAPFVVSIPAGQEPHTLQFTVRRATGAPSATVRLVVADACGEWSTLVGGGASVW